MERLAGNERFLIAVRAGGDGSISARFTLPPGLNAKKAAVRFEGRTLNVEANTFADSFADTFETARSVHIYFLGAT